MKRLLWVLGALLVAHIAFQFVRPAGAIPAQVGDGRTPEQVADGFLQIAVANMAEAVKKEYLLPSNTRTMCSWKGQASYHTVFVDGDANPDAAWYYPEPMEAAAQIKGRVAFWKGVQVVE